MENVFWVGVYPGLTEAMVDYMIESFHDVLTGGAGAGIEADPVVAAERD
jgi:CDP-6-deoxy-D-xylo-4-hexulose-3-dehydrase